MFGKVGMFYGEQGLPRDLCDELNEEIINNNNIKETEVNKKASEIIN